MNKNTMALFFSLVRSAISGNRMDDREKQLCLGEDLSEWFAVAKRHDIAHLLAIGMKTNDIPFPMGNGMENEIIKAIYRYEQLHYELNQVCRILNEAEVDFLPLKGSVIRRYYREPWMRTSCDIDVLIHGDDLDRSITALVGNLAYVYDVRGPHDVSLHAPSGMHVELHYDLIEEGVANVASSVLESIWNVALPQKGHQYEMPEEIFYFYHIAHMAKHFEFGGCGIRPFIDLWILDQIEDTDQKKRDQILELGQLLRFAESSRMLSRVWMGEAEHTELTEQMENFILHGGVYGTTENCVAVRQQKKGGRLAYLISRIIVPYSSLKHYYPVLGKNRWLTPIMQIRRWMKIIRPSIAKKAKKELCLNRSLQEIPGVSMKKFLMDVGIQ